MIPFLNELTGLSAVWTMAGKLMNNSVAHCRFLLRFMYIFGFIENIIKYSNHFFLHMAIKLKTTEN